MYSGRESLGRVNAPPLVGGSDMADIFGDRYQVIDIIGRGGMSVVMRAHDLMTGDIVALKRVVSIQHEHEMSTPRGEFHEALLALAQEFSILASLRHPHIISVYDFGMQAGSPYLTMELLAHASPLTTAGWNQPLHQQVDLLLQLLEALVYLHRRVIVHRDLKPSNVLVTPDYRVKVLDFGVSAAIQAAVGYAGTLAYIAPEVITRGSAVIQSDLYAVGLLAYEMITGHQAFRGDDLVSIVKRMPEMSQVAGHPLATVIERLLLKQPEDRYASAQEVIAAIRASVGLPEGIHPSDARDSYLQAAPFVGRQVEFQHLAAALLAAAQGRTAFFLIGGESGVGKTRLVDEIAVRALVDGIMVLRGQAVEGGGLPYELWRQAIRRLLLSQPIDDLQAGILKEIVPDIHILLRRPIPDAPAVQPSSQQQRLVQAIIDLFRNLQTPLLLILEDLQWSRESLLPLQTLIAQGDALHGLMIAATFRDDARRELPDILPQMTFMKLDKLEQREATQLIQSMIGEPVHRDAVHDLILRESEGNTFFVIEVLRALAEETGNLEDIGKTTLPTHILTGGMKRLLQRRITQASMEQPELMRFAAVAGRRIDLRLMEEAFPGARVAEWLFRCEQLAVLDVKESHWQFVHDKLREAVLDGITAQDLPSLHRQVAVAVEVVYVDDEAYYEMLLHHWRLARNVDKELFYLTRVTQRMLDVTGQYDLARQLIERSLSGTASGNPRHTQLLVLLARAHWRLGNMAESLRQAGLALEEAERAGDNANIGDILRTIGNVYLHQADYTNAEHYYQRSLGIYQETNDKYGIAAVLNNLGNTELHQGHIEVALAYYLDCLALQTELNSQRGTAMALNNLGELYCVQRKFAEATNCHQRSIELYRSAGDQRGVASNLNNLGKIATSQKDYPQARRYFEEGLTIYRGIRYGAGIATSLAHLAHLILKMGEIEEALPFLVESLAVARQIGATPVILHDLLGFVHVYLSRGDVFQAARLLAIVNMNETFDPEHYGAFGDAVAAVRAAGTSTEIPTSYVVPDLPTIVREVLTAFTLDLPRRRQTRPDDQD